MPSYAFFTSALARVSTSCERLDPILELRLVGLPLRQQPPQLRDDARVLLECPPADILQRLVAGQEARILLVADPQLLLRLHQRVGVEHPLDLGRA